MKINGKKIKGLNTEVLVIPRQSGNIVFKAQCVLDYDAHDKLSPPPNAPVRLLPGGIKQQNVEDPKYREAMSEWAMRKYAWMFITSLRATDGLEWETVKEDDPTTWTNYKEELKDSGFAPGEIARIELCVSNACGLNQDKIDEATEAFLAGLAALEAVESGQSSAQETTPSGEPASAQA